MARSLPCAAALIVSCALAVPTFADVFADHVDANAVRHDLISLVDLYNGGLNGTTGSGAYSAPMTLSPSFDGLFNVNLNRSFNTITGLWNPDMSAISQSRAIYLNTAAYRADPANGSRFLQAADLGANYLWNYGYDNPATGGYGGIYWGLALDQSLPPREYFPDHRHIGGTYATHKMSYGQVHTIFSLAHTSAITGSGTLLNDAYTTWGDYKTHFGDTANGAGAYLPSQNRDFTAFEDNRNVDYMTHTLEATMELYDATPSADARRSGVKQDMLDVGNFIVNNMTQTVAGHSDQLVIPWAFDANWQPITGTTVSTGHQIELAYLLSRAVEHGAPTAWLDTANKLLNYGLAYGTDMTPGSDYYGAELYGTVNLDGSPTGGAQIGWWQQAELARATLEFATLRGRSDLWADFDAAWATIQNALVDPTYGGWFENATWDPNTQTWVHNGTNKGGVWHVGYHETMLYDEMLRLADLTAAPEPASLGLMVVGAGALLRRRRK